MLLLGIVGLGMGGSSLPVGPGGDEIHTHGNEMMVF